MNADLYTIQTVQVAPHKELSQVVAKHQTRPFQRPISTQQQEIFYRVAELVKRQPVILDVGCGTGMSSEKIAVQHPDQWVIGIDKSLVRLSKNCCYQQGGRQGNLLLVRAQLIDFWRLAVAAKWQVDKQYILYPNPYPKAKDLNKRWHGHAVFPYLMQLGATIELRANWRLYLEEFLMAAQQLTKNWGHITVMNSFAKPLSAFEKKYWQNGVKTYQLILHRALSP